MKKHLVINQHEFNTILIHTSVGKYEVLLTASVPHKLVLYNLDHPNDTVDYPDGKAIICVSSAVVLYELGPVVEPPKKVTLTPGNSIVFTTPTYRILLDQQPGQLNIVYTHIHKEE